MKTSLLICIIVCCLFHKSFAQAKAATPPIFNHTTIYVTDLKRSSDFYTKVMQLPEIPEPFHDNRHVWLKVGEHSQIHLVSGAKEDTQHDINIHLAFSVPSIEVFMQHLDTTTAKYGDWKQAPKTIQNRPDGVKQIYLQDPDGYWIEVNDDKF